MITRALEKYLRISAKKTKPVADLIRGKKVEEAIDVMAHLNKKAARVLKAVLESALANARRIPEKDFVEEDLYISRLEINQGPTLKRYRAMSLGRAGMIRKRSSHVLVELEAPRKAAEEIKAVKKVKKPRKGPLAGFKRKGK